MQTGISSTFSVGVIKISEITKQTLDNILQSQSSIGYFKKMHGIRIEFPKIKLYPWLSYAEWYERLIKSAERKISEWERLHNIKTSCQAGCYYCCKQPVVITGIEAQLIATWIIEYKPYLKNVLSEWMTSFDKSLLNTPQSDQNLIASYRKKYFQNQYYCPFLEQNECSIYPVRPISCISYLSYSDPQKCSIINDPDTCLSLDSMDYWMFMQMKLCYMVNQSKLTTIPGEREISLLPVRLHALLCP